MRLESVLDTLDALGDERLTSGNMFPPHNQSTSGRYKKHMNFFDQPRHLLQSMGFLVPHKRIDPFPRIFLQLLAILAYEHWVRSRMPQFHCQLAIGTAAGLFYIYHTYTLVALTALG